MTPIRPLLLAPALLLAAIPVLAADLTPGQLEAAGRVYTGTADCEFNQQVSLTPVAGKTGHFLLQHKNTRYTVVPEETTTGAVRLEDKQAGIVWLQIPAKSMLMNAKVGRRVIDDCRHPEQKDHKVATSKG